MLGSGRGLFARRPVRPSRCSNYEYAAKYTEEMMMMTTKRSIALLVVMERGMILRSAYKDHDVETEETHTALDMQLDSAASNT